MREILFRAKRIDNGEWVVGSLLVSKTGKTYIRYYPAGDSKTSLQTAVDPNTVGQYTGLYDKNGKKIFEGDVVKATQSRVSDIATISFDHAAFTVIPINGKIYEAVVYEYWLNDWDLEVIGNICDNPELLEVSK